MLNRSQNSSRKSTSVGAMLFVIIILVILIIIAVIQETTLKRIELGPIKADFGSGGETNAVTAPPSEPSVSTLAPTTVPITSSSVRPSDNHTLSVRPNDNHTLTGRILNPMDGDRVNPGIVKAEGTIDGSLDGKQLWTLVEVTGPAGHPFWELTKEGATVVWPNPVKLDGNSWEADVVFGNAYDERHKDLTFRLRLVSASPALAQHFDAKLKNKQPVYISNDQQENKQSADPATELAAVNVVRK